MIPDEVFKRRPGHNNTPESILLIIANFIVVSVANALCVSDHHIHWFFWIIIGLLAVYNFFTIRKNYEEYNKMTIIAYIVSLVVLIALVFVLQMYS